MQEHYEAMVEQVVSNHFPENHTTTNLPLTLDRWPYPEEYDALTTFEEFYQWGRDYVAIEVMVGTPSTMVNDFRNQAMSLEEDLVNLFPIGSLNINLLAPGDYEVWADICINPPDDSDEIQLWDIPRVDRVLHEWGK